MRKFLDKSLVPCQQRVNAQKISCGPCKFPVWKHMLFYYSLSSRLLPWPWSRIMAKQNMDMVWSGSFPESLLVLSPFSPLKIDFSRAKCADLSGFRRSFPLPTTHSAEKCKYCCLLWTQLGCKLIQGRPNRGWYGITCGVKEAWGRGCWLPSPSLAWNEQSAEGVLYTALNPCELVCH